MAGRPDLSTDPPSDEFTWLSGPCEAFLVAGIALGVVAVAAVLLALLARRGWRAALFWSLAFGGIAALDVSLKPLFERPAISGSGYSFPAGTRSLRWPSSSRL